MIYRLWSSWEPLAMDLNFHQAFNSALIPGNVVLVNSDSDNTYNTVTVIQATHSYRNLVSNLRSEMISFTPTATAQMADHVHATSLFMIIIWK